MPDVLVALLLGVVQGLTEFLPISSTAHLALAERALGLDPERFGLAFDVALHMGTLLAVLIYFVRTWLGLVRDVLRGQFAFAILLVVATIPAVVFGLLIHDAAEGPLRDPRAIAVTLVLGSIVFVLAEWLGRGGRTNARVSDAAVMGFAQALAILPGFSRSGLTISAGLMVGLRRDQAARFSFLLSTPAIVAAGAKTLLDASRAGAVFAQPDVLVVGIAASFVSGLGAIAFLLRFLRHHSLAWFVPYRIALACAIIVAVAFDAI